MRFFKLIGCVLLLQSCFLLANSKNVKNRVFSNFLSNNRRLNEGDCPSNGTNWAVLVAGSTGWGNYRHQADVCHAYQILKRGGIKDENIIVFMYDDIANYEENPKPGVIINQPNGVDVYTGVPKDYTGENVTVNNLFAVILGNKSALTGGSGKVVNSGPNDYIFIYYTDHGGPGVVEMPDQPLYATDLIEVLKKKYELNAYKSMVFYLEACESGSMFEGILPTNINIYATTAANSSEDSWAEYCPGFGTPTGYDTCLGDLYSISWLEDCDAKNLTTESLESQYKAVQKRTLAGTAFNGSSHVMQYGDKSLDSDFLSVYLGPAPPCTPSSSSSAQLGLSFPTTSVPQRDADLLHLQHKVQKSVLGSKAYVEAQKKLGDELAHRAKVDTTINRIGQILFGHENASQLSKVRPAGQPLVDDWDCLKKHVKTYETHCGSLSTYGLKYMRHFANMCNFGVTTDQLVAVSSLACS